MLKMLNENEVKQYMSEDDFVNLTKNKTYIAYMKDEVVKCIAVVYKSLFTGKLEFMKSLSGTICDVIQNESVEDDVKEMFYEMSKEYPQIAVGESDYINYSYYGDYYNLLELIDPLCELEFENKIKMNDNIVYTSKFNKTDFQLEFENQVNSIQLGELQYKVLNKEEFKKIMFSNGDWNYHLVGNNATVQGFHYFTANDLVGYYGPKNLEFIVCLSGDKVVGVMKIADYENYSISYKGLNYVDVHIKYRRKGIAKGLYKELDKHLSNGEILISSHPSEMGKKVGIANVRKECLKTLENYDTFEDYYNSKNKQ